MVPCSVVVALVTALSAASPGGSESPPDSTSTSALRIETDRVQHDVVERGLDLRSGPRWRRLTIEITDGAQPDQVDVRMRERSGRVHTRTLSLMSETVDDRSRELASTLALVIDQLPPESTETSPPVASTTQTPPTPAPSGWIGVGPRGALNAGRPVDPEIGVSLAGGAWLLREHLQPLMEVSWAGWSRGQLRLDAIRFGGGVAAGAAMARGRLWSGAGVLLRAQWSRAAASTEVATGWWASPAVLATLQYRGAVFVAGGGLGVDLSLPPLRAYDGEDTMRWSSVRPMATVHVGIRLPPRRP